MESIATWWRSLWTQRNRRGVVDADGRKRLLVRTRSVGVLLDDASSDLESPLGLPGSPFHNHLILGTTSGDVSDLSWSILRDGSGIQKLVDSCPEEVISVLKEHAVIKLGTIQATDSVVLRAFGATPMLTRGSAHLDDPDWKEHWEKFIDERARNKSRTISVGWEEMVVLGAYAVNIKNIAVRDQGALLQLLLQKSSSGAASKKIWDFLAVRAVINYHWQHWAGWVMFAQALLFLCWLASTALYVMLYIMADCTGSWKHHPMTHCPQDPVNGTISAGSEHSGGNIVIDDSGDLKDYFMPAVSADILNILSFVLMIPFAIVEYWTILAQKWRWIQLVNMLDMSCILVQVLQFICHLMHWPLSSEGFSVILAFQCLFLFAKLQNYGRVLGVGASFSEIFFSAMYSVRYLLLYMIFTGFSTALCLGALYKHDNGFQETRFERDFKTLRNSIVTTFQIIFSGFHSEYIFDADYPWIKMFFFFGFQILMSITILNLLIAVMTESYAKFAAENRIRYNRSRAIMIDELEVLGIPSLLRNRLDPYIHFLVVEKKPRVTADQRPSFPESPQTQEELNLKLDLVSQKVDMLLQVLASKENLDMAKKQEAQEEVSAFAMATLHQPGNNSHPRT